MNFFEMLAIGLCYILMGGVALCVVGGVLMATWMQIEDDRRADHEQTPQR